MNVSADYTSLLINSVIMGFVAVILGYIFGYVTKPFVGISLPDACKSWNKYRMMEVNLFLIGFFVTIIYCMFKNTVGTNISLKL